MAPLANFLKPMALGPSAGSMPEETFSQPTKLSDLANSGTARTNLGLGALATAAAVSGGMGGTITDDTITDADINASAAIAQSKISGLTASLAAKEATITAGTTSQYYRGDKSWQTLNTTNVTEGTNLYYTDARARGAVSVTAPLAYNSGTGAFTIALANTTTAGYLSSTSSPVPAVELLLILPPAARLGMS
jgi:hypothetical protein